MGRSTWGVYIYILVSVCVYLCLSAYIYVLVSVCLSAYIYVLVSVCLCVAAGGVHVCRAVHDVQL